MIPDELRFWREMHGCLRGKGRRITQKEAAQILGCSLRHYQKMEGGEIPIPRVFELACVGACTEHRKKEENRK